MTVAKAAFRGAVVSLAMWTAACSFTVQGPRSTTPTSAPRCEDSATGRFLLDLTGAGYWGLWSAVSAAWFFDPPCSEHGTSFDLCLGPTEKYEPAAAILSLLFGGMATLHGSAIATGKRRTRRCREAKRAYADWQRLPPDERERRRNAAAAKRIKRGSAPPGLHKSIPAECQDTIARWRREQDPVYKTLIYNRMSPRCQQAITRPAPRAAP